MNILILAAGYATRLHPLTANKAKPLLEVAGKPMIEWILDNLAPIPDIDEVFVVTNQKFAADFSIWASNYQSKQPCPRLRIVNDGTTSDADKLGAIGDIHFALNKHNLFGRDLIVVAGDNLFSQPVDGFAAFARNYPATVAVYDMGGPEEVKKYNNISLEADGRIKAFEEKPATPSSTKSGIALYYYRQDVLPMINQYIEEGNNPDQPGRLVQWLHPRIEFRTWEAPGTWFDIGSKETLEEANRVFAHFATSN